MLLDDSNRRDGEYPVCKGCEWLISSEVEHGSFPHPFTNLSGSYHLQCLNAANVRISAILSAARRLR
jgi:hypothetical protein